MDTDHRITELLEENRRLEERIAALEAEVESRRQEIAEMKEILNRGSGLLMDAALETGETERVGNARREGARRALEWFVRQPRGDDSVGWVLTKSYDQMIAAALGEVDRGS